MAKIQSQTKGALAKCPNCGINLKDAAKQKDLGRCKTCNSDLNVYVQIGDHCTKCDGWIPPLLKNIQTKGVSTVC